MSSTSPWITGSSPLARGLLYHRVNPLTGAGIIPARAGFTGASGRRRSRERDHPRSRGVYNRPRRVIRCFAGSSPLARGLRMAKAEATRDPRIIPARAGFTPSAGGFGASGQDHPRSRGVYVRFSMNWTRLLGSSPLARGLQSAFCVTPVPPGIIPARAGFTQVAGTLGQ